MAQSSQQESFDIPGALHFEAGPGGLTRGVISTQAADGEFYLHGAHVTKWNPRGSNPVLFLSSKTLYRPGKAIRGGIPVIFPWFGPRGDGMPGPMHGFARTAEWTLERTALRNDGAVEVTLALQANDETRACGYGAFKLRFAATFGETLRMELETHNSSADPLIFEEALHAYFAIGDIRQLSVSGLERIEYIDKTDDFRRKQQSAEPIRISSETDRVYLNTAAACMIEDPTWQRRIIIEKSGSQTTVVWNPWIEKTKSLADMAPDDWQRMICVETANAADNAVHLVPGAAHVTRLSIRVEDAS
jgi:glucose-6-phosphate 1-epimerase